MKMMEMNESDRRSGGTRCWSKRLRKKRRKYAEAMAAVLASIMEHSYDQ